MRAAVWKARAALLYSLGGWTALGGMIYYCRESGGGPENENDPRMNQVASKEVHTTETPLGFQVRMEVKYKDVQPPITRLLRHVVSLFDASGSSPSEK